MMDRATETAELEAKGLLMPETEMEAFLLVVNDVLDAVAVVRRGVDPADAPATSFRLVAPPP